MLIFTFGRWHT